MSASKIQYQNKERDKHSGKPAEKTWRYQDANEVKDVVNQHADEIDALGGSDMQKSVYDPQNIEGDAFDRSNHTGTQTASTISDFDTSVSGSTQVAANTAKRSYPSADETRLANTSGTNTGDETTSTIQTKRPLKTVNNTSLEGTGNIEILGGVESVNGESGDVELTAEDIDTTATSGKTIKAEIDENPTATQLGRIKAVFDSNSGEFVMSIDGTDIT